jgi:hypothetical protein
MPSIINSVNNVYEKPKASSMVRKPKANAVRGKGGPVSVYAVKSR